MRKRCDDTFKQDAANLLATSGRPLKALARELGVRTDMPRSRAPHHAAFAHLPTPLPG